MELEGYLLDCVRHAIPRVLLDLLGDDYVLVLQIEGYLNKMRKMTTHDIPVRFWHDVALYVINRIKFDVFIKTTKLSASDLNKIPGQLREMAHEYKDTYARANGVADDILKVWEIYERSMRCGKA